MNFGISLSKSFSLNDFTFFFRSADETEFFNEKFFLRYIAVLRIGFGSIFSLKSGDLSTSLEF